MKKILFTSLLYVLAISAACASDEDILAEYTTGSLKDQLYVVDSSELDPAESLNRVSGDIDLGFSGPSNTYQSASHLMASPFAQQTVNDNRDGAE